MKDRYKKTYPTAQNTLFDMFGVFIRKKSVTYIGYIDLYRSIGPLGNPLIYRSS